jgi:PilZ domain
MSRVTHTLIPSSLNSEAIMSQTLPFWKRLDQWLRPASVVFTPAEEADPAPPPDFERRGATRHSAHVETQCMLIALVKSDPWLVLIRDVSTTGAGFEFPCPLPNGTFIVLELPRRSRRDPEKMLRAQVMSSREQEDGSYVIGCAFARRLTEEELDRMG